MEFLYPAGLWLGLAAAGVLTAHLVRRRARRHEVPFLPLWAAVVAQQRGGWGAAVARWLDLLLVLLACVAVAIAAAGPFTPGTPDRVRDLVLVLDGGVSLRAGERHARLLKVGEAEVRRRAPGTRFVVIGVGDQGATVWAGTDKARAVEAVRAHAPGWLEPAPTEALALAAEARAVLRDADVVFVTHRRVDAEDVRWRAVVQDVKNAGVAGLEVVGDPEGGGALARLTLRGDGPVEVEGQWAGEVHGTRAVDVPVSGAGDVTLRVRAEGDGFAPDDAAYLRLPEQELPRVLVVAAGEPSPFLSAALQALEATGAIRGPLDRVAPDHVATAAAHYDVCLFDRCAPPERVAGLRALYVAPPPGALPFRLGEEGDAPALFDLRRESPLLQGLDLTRVAPLRARAVLGGTPAASAAPGPVLSSGPGWVALGFDPDRCILAASPAWPLLLRNCIAYLAPARQATRPEFYAVGEPAPRGGLATLPGDGRRNVGARLLGPPGFWRFDDETLAVDLLGPLDLRSPARESDPLPPVGTPGRPDEPRAALFAAAGILFLLLAWWLFWRG